MAKPFITLISPPIVSSPDSEYYIGRKGAPPLNLAYLARAINDINVDYDIIDCLATDSQFTVDQYNLRGLGLSAKEVIARLDPRTTIVGISAMFTNEWLLVREIAQEIKKVRPDIFIIVGGEHVTAMSTTILKYEKCFDMCFEGEADISIREFLLSATRNEGYLNVPGVSYRSTSGEILTNARASRLTALDDIFPLWDKIPVEYYIQKRYSFSRIDVKSMPILATRGCPYKCTFCSNKNMWGYRYVMRSVDSILTEMRFDIQKYGVENFDFLDLATSINKTWFKELLTTLIKELPDITWKMSVGTRSEILDEEILTLLKKSGTKQIAYAPETGSQRLSDLILKRVNYKNMFKSIQTALDLGLEVKVHLIIGFPEENILDFFKTLFMALRFGWLGVKGVLVFVFSPYPGSQLFEKKYNLKSMTAVQYEELLYMHAHNAAGARVFSISQLWQFPRDQLYTFASNIAMISAYFIGAIRHPKHWVDLYLNVKNHSPSCAFEFAVYTVLQKFRLSKKIST